MRAGNIELGLPHGLAVGRTERAPPQTLVRTALISENPI